MTFNMDILHTAVIIVDIFVVIFLIWRALTPKATLWGSARFIYIWIATLTLYHAVIYSIGFFLPDGGEYLIKIWLHPLVVLYTLNPVLIAIIHWKGGRLI
jgi:hypothetical protein